MVHTFKSNGYNFIVDGNSGSVHITDDLCCEIISEKQYLPPLSDNIDKFGRKYSPSEIEEAYKEIENLKNEGTLFSPLQNIEEIFDKKNKSTGLKALCLNVSHDCNLSCEYCFASKGDYKSGKRLMTKETALRAVDFLVENTESRHNIEIDFFGGEPLMNFDVVKETVRYGKKIEKQFGKEFYFTITTNGVLLNDEKIDFINEYMDNIVISIDGRKEVHDSMRYDKKRRGTYDIIVPLAQKLISKRNKGEKKSYFIRGTFTSKNKDFYNDIMHLASLGFKEISVEPVVGTGDALFIREEDVPYILDEYDKFAADYLKLSRQGNSFRFYHFNLNLYDGPCVNKRITACGAGFEYLAVSPEGKFYPCHQFVGQKEFVMGDVFSGVENKELETIFRNSNILTKEKCSSCWAKLFCSGGCHANAWYSNKDISKPNEIACTLQKKRIECAIMIQAALQEESAGFHALNEIDAYTESDEYVSNAKNI